MEVKELRIGDWVHYNDGILNQYVKIKNGAQIDGYISHLSPIVLTDKILKVNGFKNCTVIAGCDEFVIDYIFEKLCEDCVIQITLNPYVIDIFPYDAENNKTADKAVYTIPFGDGGVHELQQALGLCGLSEIADDFIIE